MLLLQKDVHDSNTSRSAKLEDCTSEPKLLQFSQPVVLRSVAF